MLMCNQNWFRIRRMRYNGCGPTTGANLLVNHYKYNFSKEELIDLMEEIYEYMSPHAGGVYPPEFISGINMAIDDGKAVGFWIKSNDRKDKRRFDNDLYNKCIKFINDSLSRGEYVAFLNLNNGGVPRLSSWHWVTIIGIDSDIIKVYDNGNTYNVDFKRWYNNGTKRGGLVSIC